MVRRCQVAIDVIQQAAKASDTYNNATPLASDATLVVNGSRSAATVTLSAGATTQQIVDAFNDVTYLTGVRHAVNGTTVDFSSTEYGSDATINIQATTGAFATAQGNGVEGTDAIANVNGQQVVADGTTLAVTTSTLGLSIELDPAANRRWPCLRFQETRCSLCRAPGLNHTGASAYRH